jgi:hypothetical protein
MRVGLTKRELAMLSPARYPHFETPKGQPAHGKEIRATDPPSRFLARMVTEARLEQGRSPLLPSSRFAISKTDRFKADVITDKICQD